MLACTALANDHFSIRDFLTLSRKIKPILFSMMDTLLVLVLPLCMWYISIVGFVFATDLDGYDDYDDIYTEYGIIMLMPTIISLLYVLIVGVVTIYHKKRGIHCLLYKPEDSANLSHREGMVKHSSYFLFHHSYFRKHSCVMVHLTVSHSPNADSFIQVRARLNSHYPRLHGSHCLSRHTSLLIVLGPQHAARLR